MANRHASIDELDRAICSLAGRINAATHDLLVLIRRFDERAGRLRWSFENCVDWLHWRCDLSLSAPTFQITKTACGSAQSTRSRLWLLRRSTSSAP
ncbi:MAG TPA: hypothetical protein VE175_15440 [Woeseiaceae bacterium]|jgi:hypothetical protein|nr:hypothetical protein [Woeseiaceae bacterium]